MPRAAVSHHNSRSCRLCEPVPPDRYRRHWKHEPKIGAWHVLPDGSDLMARLPRQAHFITILSYRLNRQGKPAQYRGPLYWEFDSDDPVQAFKELRRCLALLDTLYNCPLEAVRVWHSGGRGAHVTIPAAVFGAKAGHPQLPRIYATMIQQLFPPQMAPSLDRTIYSRGKGRMWRLANRRRSDTGRYKVPLAMREVLHQSYACLEVMTLEPRKGHFWPVDHELSQCPQLVRLYEDTVTAVEGLDRHHPGLRRTQIGMRRTAELLLARCAFIRYCRNHAASLSEPEWYAMISNVARCANGPTTVHQLSAPYPGYLPQETDAKIAHALKDTGPHTCAFIQGLGFQGCPAGGCGVKAPVGLIHGSAQATHQALVQIHAGGLRVCDVVATDRQGIRTVAAGEIVGCRA